MQLTLSVKETPRLPGVAPTYRLSSGSAIIGRAPRADWCLPDSERILSKTHCRIDGNDNGFVVTDLSTNGVFVNGASVGYEQSHQLTDGDRLRLGDLAVSVAITAAEEQADSDHTAELFPTHGPFDDDTDGGANTASKPTMTTTVDCMPAPGGGAETGQSTPVSSPTTAIVMSLVRSFPDLDVSKLALAIDSAGAEISEAEWQAFYLRLRTFLQERYSKN